MGQVACRCGHGAERHVQKQRQGSTVIDIVCMTVETLHISLKHHISFSNVSGNMPTILNVRSWINLSS